MRHVVSIGGGLSSTMELPRRVIDRYGRENVTLLMARLPNEDPDLWRLCDAVQADLGVPITYIGLNLTPWDIFFRERMMGSSRVDPCSRVLKREVLSSWLCENCERSDTLLHVGITYHEIDRMIKIRAGYETAGYQVAADLADDPSVTREWLMAACEEHYGFVPRLYRWGFSHNNCGGFCVKGGLQEWARALWYLPDVYGWWERNEYKFRRSVGTDATILRDRRKGADIHLTLGALRQRCRRWWAGTLPGLPFELLPRVRDLPATPACVFCTAA